MAQRFDDIQITIVKELSRGAYFSSWTVLFGEYTMELVARFESAPYIVYNKYGKRIVEDLDVYGEDAEEIIDKNYDQLVCIFYLPREYSLPLG